MQIQSVEFCGSYPVIHSHPIRSTDSTTVLHPSEMVFFLSHAFSHVRMNPRLCLTHIADREEALAVCSSAPVFSNGCVKPFGSLLKYFQNNKLTIISHMKSRWQPFGPPKIQKLVLSLQIRFPFENLVALLPVELR